MAPADDAFKFINVAQHLHAGVGIVAEGIQARRESRERRNRVEERPGDQAGPELGSSTNELPVAGTLTAVCGSGENCTGKLELPVILPQRRPKERSRGFLRAYAPLLANVAISQQMWFDFLDDFEKSTQATGWIKTINVASLASHVVPEPFSMLVSLAVKETIRIAEEVDSRQKTNKFLDKANAEIFRPRGVFCMVMTWRPDSEEVHPTVDLNTTATISASTDSSSFSNRFKASSGTSYGDLKIPAAAPLVFPPEQQQQLEGGVEEEVGLKQRFKRTKGFVDDYLDRRAQAVYATENPDNLLATQVKTKFRSKYADPNHPANIDPLGSFLTGGYTDQLHRDSKARTDAAQAQAQKSAAEARRRADAAQEQAQRAIAEARARAEAAQANAREAQRRAGYVTAPAPLPGLPSRPYASAPGPPNQSVVPSLATPVPLNALSQVLVEGSQRLVSAQQKYINFGTEAIQDVLRTNVIYLTLVSLPAEAEQ
ncbi:uncharacterized protein CTRU02_213453 [Colletotrichum truncatum]|uniref:Uncharacterized protein n=1 Tax=Colletotrichum truncatum TaxID=5467 RepID=A0ACC3YKR2_COLTU|nr:uncharacterized protein CTRU02_13447 [Colletotrichum truncatum]KAF6783457.1 hypothetical protein CTRU02_13447 [Colletotrichum truncatum]